MSEIIDFFAYADLEAMDREQLLERLRVLRAQIEELDKLEPRNMDSEAYEEWGQAHEDLEDLVDDVLDKLDQLG